MSKIEVRARSLNRDCKHFPKDTSEIVIVRSGITTSFKVIKFDIFKRLLASMIFVGVPSALPIVNRRFPFIAKSYLESAESSFIFLVKNFLSDINSSKRLFSS